MIIQPRVARSATLGHRPANDGTLKECERTEILPAALNFRSFPAIFAGVKALVFLPLLGMALPALGGPLYNSWASWNGLAGTEAAPDADPDGDGIPNSVEFVVSSTPNPFQANFSPARLLPISTIDPNYLIVSYRRSSPSTEFPSAIQYSTSLLTWQNAVNGVSGVVITVEPGGFGTDDRGSPIDRVTVKLPRSLAREGKLFARLSVTSS